jgi:hypothetical protein
MTEAAAWDPARILSSILGSILRRYPPGSDGLVFTMPKGGPVRRQTFYHR